MKLDARRIDGFLSDPGQVRAVLFHGEDAGLIRERATRLVRAVAGALDDPFRVAELERDSAAELVGEVSAMSLSGGRRVVRLRDATDGVTSWVQKALDISGGGLLVLEGSTLTGKSKLKTLLERSDHAAVIACYKLEPRAVAGLVRSVMSEARIDADTDAVEWLSGQLGADRAVSESELDKLALYIGPGGRLDMEAARLCVGDLAGLQLEDALFAATDGDVVATDRALELALSEGAAPVGALRAALMHVQRLVRARALMADGMAADAAAKALRPPVFFKREPVFTRALRAWSLPALENAAQRCWEAERACKRTGAPADVICRNAILGLAQRGAAAKRR